MNVNILKLFFLSLFIALIPACNDSLYIGLAPILLNSEERGVYDVRIDESRIKIKKGDKKKFWGDVRESESGAPTFGDWSVIGDIGEMRGSTFHAKKVGRGYIILMKGADCAMCFVDVYE